MTNLEKYNNAFTENLQISEDKLNGLQYQGVELWDSVGHMTLMAAIEDAFDIMLDTDDIVDFSSYEKGKEMSGFEAAAAAGALVFHCGSKAVDGKIVTAGGRVLSVTGMGATLREAVDTAYAGVKEISFDGMFYRKDIAHRAFERQ